MSTNKLTNLRGGETLKDHNRHTNNKDGQDKCYVYKNHITKIRIISDMTRGTSALCKKNIFLIFFYKAGWSLHSKGCCSLSPTSLSHCLYKDSNTI